MINQIVDHLNTRLEELEVFEVSFGLCEIIKKNDTSFPAEYSNGEFKSVSDFEGATVYHRLTGDITSSEADEESSVSCDPFIERNFPMKLVGVVKKTCGYNDNEIALFVANKINFSNNKVLRTALKADVVSVEIKNISTDRDKIWNDEYKGIEMKMPYENIYLAVEYNIVITGNSSCFPTYECNVN